MVKYDQSKTNDSATITEVKSAREPSMKFDTTFLFGNLGDVIELNAWVPADIIEQIDALNSDPSKILRSREADDYQGPKDGCEYNHIPEGWDLPDHATTLGSLIYNRGQYLYPHRDKFRKVTPEGIFGDSFRLINHINHTSSTEFHFVVDGKIFKPEPRRWYAINTRKVHYGFSFVDGVYHLSAALGLEDQRREATVKWLLEKLPFAVDFQSDRKGVDCGRN